MPYKIVRNDITKMQTDAIVNTANSRPVVGTGCDTAVYQAAGREELLAYRSTYIGEVEEGEAFLTPGFGLQAKYIIHGVSPRFTENSADAEQKLRRCYRNCLAIAVETGIASVAFPLISTGSFGYPKEEGLRIALDEIQAFLKHHELLIYLVVFDETSTELSKAIAPNLESYIDSHYVEEKGKEEYADRHNRLSRGKGRKQERILREGNNMAQKEMPVEAEEPLPADVDFCYSMSSASIFYEEEDVAPSFAPMRKEEIQTAEEISPEEFEERHGDALEERMRHRTDTFSEYLMYLIDSKGLDYPDVYKRAIIDKKVFSKIKNNPDAHPKKITAMCLCVGAKLNLDEAKDLLARAGYALSPCDKTDIIFSYFIENKIYNMIELDIQLENHNLPCLIA